MQKRFIRELPKNRTATKAAIRAGYSKRTAGVIASENLRKPEIAAAIIAKQNQLDDESMIDAVWLRKQFKHNAELAQVAGQYSATNSALDSLGKHAGFYAKDNKQRCDATRKLLDMLE